MSSRFQQDQAEEARESRIKSQTEAFKTFLEQKHPEIRFGIALLNEVREYMGEGFLTGADEDFEYTLQNGVDTRYVRQHVPTPQEVRDELVEDICEKLRSPRGDGSGGRYSDENLKSLRLQMRYWSTAELKAKLETITLKQSHAKRSLPELKQIVRAAQPQRRLDGYPNLPDFIVMPGNVQATKCDAAFLLRLAKQDFFEYRRLVSRFGPDQINERQQGKS